jgi:hypothetical protein
MDRLNEAKRVDAALRSLLFGGDAATRRRGARAAEAGEICGACGRRLTLQETVWRLRLPAGTSPVSRRDVTWVAPACAACLPSARWATVPRRPCEGCGRRVVDCCRSRSRRITSCCERRRRRAWNRRRITKRREVVCASCGQRFRPSRTDAWYCSGPCRQKAWRARRRPP